MLFLPGLRRLCYPLSNDYFTGLFQAVIPQSGCALSPWAIYRPPHNSSTYSKILAEKVGCINSSSADMVHCLRGISADLLALTSTGVCYDYLSL